MNRFTQLLFAVLAASTCASSAFAHHGSAISYDIRNLWTTWATVTEFNYMNPHPTMKFDRTVKDGAVEHWVAELATNPSALAFSGWTKGRTKEAMKPGTRVKLYLGSSRVAALSAIVLRIENDKGEIIVGDARMEIKSVDLDGVPGGMAPKGGNIPGQSSGQ